MQTYFESEQNLALLLEQAQQKGEVRIPREDGQTFDLKREKSSSLDVAGIELGVSTAEIVQFIREGRKQSVESHDTAKSERERLAR